MWTCKYLYTYVSSASINISIVVDMPVRDYNVNRLFQPSVFPMSFMRMSKGSWRTTMSESIMSCLCKFQKCKLKYLCINFIKFSWSLWYVNKISMWSLTNFLPPWISIVLFIITKYYERNARGWNDRVCPPIIMKP